MPVISCTVLTGIRQRISHLHPGHGPADDPRFGIGGRHILAERLAAALATVAVVMHLEGLGRAILQRHVLDMHHAVIMDMLLAIAVGHSTVPVCLVLENGRTRWLSCAPNRKGSHRKCRHESWIRVSCESGMAIWFLFCDW